ncbi:hypothetical protein HY213_04715 [Candidatus Peregrinibacteria bacterium]|nr:hypothetical protein [Candidatus Peregrinibacteria bacterium]
MEIRKLLDIAGKFNAAGLVDENLKQKLIVTISDTIRDEIFGKKEKEKKLTRMQIGELMLMTSTTNHNFPSG